MPVSLRPSEIWKCWRLQPETAKSVAAWAGNATLAGRYFGRFTITATFVVS